jgi:chlorobactene glucosyltransferase
MIYVGYILLAMLGLRFVVTLVNFVSRPYLSKRQKMTSHPFVSVLIPARNEEKSLPGLLADLEQSDYPSFEVIVCNDRSSDGTVNVIEGFLPAFSNLQWFNSDEMPEGWIGKNFACHQLAQKSTGDYLLFLDADVRVTPGFISKMIGHAVKRKLALLSVFPQQIIGSRGEWCTVPLMNWILLTFLPLLLVRLKWFSSLSAANGQTMLFDAKLYRNYNWHAQVKERNVEDILIARKMKTEKLPVEVVLGSNDVSCRMYDNYADAVNGFSRNIHQYFGGNRAWMLFFVMVSWARIPLLAIILSPLWAFFALLVVALMKWMVSQLSGQSAIKNFIFLVNQQVALIIITFRNIAAARKGNVEWKGRVYHFKS